MRIGICLLAVTAACTEVSVDSFDTELPPTLVVGGGSVDPALEVGRRFVDDQVFRRQVLVDSLVHPDNAYSQQRLQFYAVSESLGWDNLPVWNPPVANFTTDDFGNASSTGLEAIPIPEGWNRDELVELGRQVFMTYPLGSAEVFEPAVESAQATADYGLWVGDNGVVGGLTKMALGGNQIAVIRTCATCHGRVDDGKVVLGVGNPDFDLGRLLYDGGAGNDPAQLTWGPGNADVTFDAASDPMGIPDLRPLRYQNHINASATVANDLAALTVRIDTLFITADLARRPPRKLVFAVALYLWSLGEVDEPPPWTDAASRGELVFTSTCAGCHHADGTTAPPLLHEQIGTDAVSATLSSRGTGYYRIPSLFKVMDRRRLLHRGQVASVAELLDPARLGQVPGHTFGTDLSADDKADLLEFLERL